MENENKKSTTRKKTTATKAAPAKKKAATKPATKKTTTATKKAAKPTAKPTSAKKKAPTTNKKTVKKPINKETEVINQVEESKVEKNENVIFAKEPVIDNSSIEENAPQALAEEAEATEVVSEEISPKEEKDEMSEYASLTQFDSDEYAKKLKRYKIWHNVGLVVKFAFLTILAIFIVVPFYWMIITSLKSLEEVELATPTFFPQHVIFNNYARVFAKGNNFAIYFGNTLIVSVATTALVVITSILAAFAFARLNFKGREALFSILLITMMVPGEMMVITNFMTISTFKWMNTYQALILPFSVSVFYIFFLRQTFKSIPNELYLAAKVDGYSDFKYLWKVMIPMSVSSIVTIIILGLMGSWNAYVWPSLVANGTNKATGNTMQMVGNGLMAIFQSNEFRAETNMKMAASAVVTAPLLVFFMIFRKIIMRGVSRSGIKG